MSSAALSDLLDHALTPGCGGMMKTANDLVLDVHSLLEGTGHETNLGGTFHGLTDLGETVGLGRIGGDNLITDAVQAVPNILNCGNPVSEVANLVTDVGKVASAGGAFVEGIGHDLSNPNVISDVGDGLGLELPHLGGLTHAGLGDIGDTLLGTLIDTNGDHCGCHASGAPQDALIDVHTDGGAIVQTHDHTDALLGLNGHGIL